MANTTLRPFRDYSEHDVINLYAFSGTIPATKGTMVYVERGWTSSDELQFLGDAGSDYANTVSDRYGVFGQVGAASNSTTNPIGMLLYDVKETDENGEKLLFNPRHAAEMEVALSGQAVPVVTRGTFLYSGSTLAAQSPSAGQSLYVDANGQLTTGVGSKLVGKTLGGVDSSNQTCLIKLEL